MVNKKEKFLIVSLAFLLAVLADRISKIAVQGSSLPYIKNTGAAFGLLKGFAPFLIVASFAAIAVLIYFYGRLPEKKILYFSFGLVLAGIVGNLTDRIFLGGVVDFIDLRFWPAFNIADLSASIGIGIIAVYLVLSK